MRIDSGRLRECAVLLCLLIQAQPAAAGLRIIAGEGQALPPSFNTRTDGREALTVRLTDEQQKPIANAIVSWRVTSGSGGLSSPQTMTDGNGVASVHYTAPALFGGYAPVENSVITAATAGGLTADFHVAIVRTDDVSASPIAVQFLNPLRVLRLRAGEVLTSGIQAVVSTNTQRTAAAAVPGVAMHIVNSTADPADGPWVECRETFALSDQQGVIHCHVAAGRRTGDTAVAAVVGGVRETFLVRVEPGSPGSIRILQGNNQTGSAGQNLAPLIIEVVDSAGNPLPGVAVKWESSDAAIADAQPATDLNGRALANVRLKKERTGPASVTVRVGSADATFTLTAVKAPGNLVVASGANQTTTAGTPFPQPVSVRVTNASGEALPSVMVDFRVDAGSAIVQPGSAQTDKYGIASASVIAGSSVGPVLVKASASGIAAVFGLMVRETAPAASAADIVNAAGLQAGVSPGSMALIRARGIATELRGSIRPYAVIGPTPLKVADVEVLFNGIAAPVQAVSNTNGEESVLVQVPYEIASGPAVVLVRAAGAEVTIENVQVWPVKPGVFTTTDAAGTAFAVATRPDGSFITAANPARRGEEIRVYAAGLGQTVPAASTGRVGVAGQSVTAPLIAGLNDAGIQVKSAQLLEGAVGVYVVTIVIPPDALPGPSQRLGLGIAGPDGQVVFANSSLVPIG